MLSFHISHICFLCASAGVSMKAFRSGPLLFVKWQSSRIVYMMSTLHDESMQTVRKRGKDVSKPSCVVAYNSNMGAVDRADQMLQPYDATRKTRRWYKKLMLHLLQVSLLNAYIVFRHTLQSKMDFLTFQCEVITSLLFAGQPTPEAVQPRTEEVVRLQERHFPHPVPQTQKASRSTRKCKVCTKKGKRKDTSYMCTQCPNQPALCVYPCFELFHTLKDYS